jgi:hypothetical protein
MSKDISRNLESLDEFRQRARETLAPFRNELTAWFRDFFRKKKGPAKSTHMNLALVRNSEGPEPQWEFGWYPGMHSRYPFFKPSQSVPVFTTEADVSSVGLYPGDVFTLRYLAFQDMAADAWEEADGFLFPKKFMVCYHEYLAPGAPRPWVEPLKQQVQQRAEGVKPLGARWGLTAPQPFGLPVTSVDLIDAVRNGGATAITDWADALERAGASEPAKLLRWLPGFHAALADEVRAVSPQFGFAITAISKGHAYWWIGDMCSEVENADAFNLGRLLSAWNEMHPAVEWLLRRFDFPHAAIEAIRYATDDNLPKKSYDLGNGQHFDPIDDDARVLKLDVPGWQPIEGDMEGD